jgi:hypothetical protein
VLNFVIISDVSSLRAGNPIDTKSQIKSFARGVLGQVCGRSVVGRRACQKAGFDLTRREHAFHSALPRLARQLADNRRHQASRTGRVGGPPEHPLVGVPPRMCHTPWIG